MNGYSIAGGIRRTAAFQGVFPKQPACYMILRLPQTENRSFAGKVEGFRTEIQAVNEETFLKG